MFGAMVRARLRSGRLSAGGRARLLFLATRVPVKASVLQRRRIAVPLWAVQREPLAQYNSDQSNVKGGGGAGQTSSGAPEQQGFACG